MKKKRIRKRKILFQKFVDKLNLHNDLMFAGFLYHQYSLTGMSFKEWNNYPKK